jgi:hypothetical protein
MTLLRKVPVAGWFLIVEAVLIVLYWKAVGVW